MSCTFHPSIRSSASSMASSVSTTDLISRLSAVNQAEADKIEAIREQKKIITHDE